MLSSYHPLLSLWHSDPQHSRWWLLHQPEQQEWVGTQPTHSEYGQNRTFVFEAKETWGLFVTAVEYGSADWLRQTSLLVPEMVLGGTEMAWNRTTSLGENTAPLLTTCTTPRNKSPWGTRLCLTPAQHIWCSLFNRERERPQVSVFS